MNSEDYYKISVENNLPARCPILNYCSRRAYTISFFSKYDRQKDVISTLLEDGVLPSDFLKNQIALQGEPPTWIEGNNNWHFSNCCPEVNLFDGGNSLFFGVACVEGDYDSYYRGNKSRPIKYQHFSKCPEFNYFKYFQKVNSVKAHKKRIQIPAKLKAILQKEINSICPFCDNEDVGHFQVHHIDEDPSNNNFENLIMLCPNCHSKITKGDISESKVKMTKLGLKPS